MILLTFPWSYPFNAGVNLEAVEESPCKMQVGFQYEFKDNYKYNVMRTK